MSDTILLYVVVLMACTCTILYTPRYSTCIGVIGASEAKPLSSVWCENQKFGWYVVSMPLWCIRTSRLYYIAIDGTYIHHAYMIVQEILSRITAQSPMVGTPIDQVRRLINQGLIKDLISPLLSVDL